MNNAKILIVEDEVLIAEYIKSLFVSFGYNNIYLSHNKNHALQKIEELEPDLVLLDLHLKNPLDGIDIAIKIDESFKVPYIFVTANNDVLIIQEAIQTKTLAYITKPIKKLDLFAAAQLALRNPINPSQNFIFIKDTHGVTKKIIVDDILFVEGTGNYITVTYKKEKIIARHTLDWAEKILPENQFMRIHRSYIINLNAINQKIANHVIIADQEIPISRTYLAKLTDYLK